MSAIRFSAAIAASLAAVAFFFGCSREAPTPTPEVIVHTYTVRGQIAMLPSPERPLNELQIRHEHIQNFSDREGNVYVNARGVRGMGSMTMPFPLAEGVSLEGFAVGDKVEVTFERVWRGEAVSFRLTEIRPLPPETELDFTTHVPEPAPDPAPDPATGG